MLNRQSICSGAYLESFDSLPKDILWTQAQIDQSMAEALAARPGEGDVWVFAYGSLMWNPISEFDERAAGTLDGWHRSFCIHLIAGRATPAQPGRMLALESGGQTQGVVLRIAQSKMQEELRILWIREMVTGAYLPRWLPVTLRNGEVVQALVFVANPRHVQYRGEVRAEVIAPLVARAAGAIGSNAEYVYKLLGALTDCGMSDPYIDSLSQVIARYA